MLDTAHIDPMLTNCESVTVHAKRIAAVWFRALKLELLNWQGCFRLFSNFPAALGLIFHLNSIRYKREM